MGQTPTYVKMNGEPFFQTYQPSYGNYLNVVETLACTMCGAQVWTIHVATHNSWHGTGRELQLLNFVTNQVNSVLSSHTEPDWKDKP